MAFLILLMKTFVNLAFPFVLFFFDLLLFFFILILCVIKINVIDLRSTFNFFVLQVEDDGGKTCLITDNSKSSTSSVENKRNKSSIQPRSTREKGKRSLNKTTRDRFKVEFLFSVTFLYHKLQSAISIFIVTLVNLCYNLILQFEFKTEQY